ncbi:MAG: helix-turn-helix domain-containing protein [Planctomycetes bacterium]|nr:helix-turn-helix domain-containing protein [Planctomycetota bacterium]
MKIESENDVIQEAIAPCATTDAAEPAAVNSPMDIIRTMRDGEDETDRELSERGYPEELTYDQVAEILGCSTRTVYRRKFPRCIGPTRRSRRIPRDAVALTLWMRRNPTK